MKFIKKMTVLVLALCLSLSFFAVGAGCEWTTGDAGETVVSGGGGISWDLGDTNDWVARTRPTADDFSDKTLNIKFFNGGYGRAWLDEMEKQFEADYPGIDVRLTASTNSSDFQDLLRTELQGNNPYDIYICHDISWESLGGDEKLLVDLTDELYNAVMYTDPTPDDTIVEEQGLTLDESGNAQITYKNLLTDASVTSAYYRDGYYKVAQVQGAGGILYNKTMFDQYGWELPETYDDLKALCEQIVEGTNGDIAPFLVAGSEGYLWDSLVYDWWIQLAGQEEFNRLFEGNDKNCWNPDEYPYHRQAYQYWYNLFVVNQSEYMLDGFTGIDNVMANAVFLQGMAAMMPATAWAVNELGADVLEESGLDVGLIPTPYVEGAKTDEDGNPLRVCYDVAGRDSIVVSTNGNSDLAIEFLKWMGELDNKYIFPKNVSGMVMGFKYDVDTLLTDEYCRFTWDRDMFKLLGETTFRTTGYSSNPMFVLKLVSAYPIENYYLRCFTTYGTASQITPSSIFASAWSQVNSKWDDWRFEAGLE